MKDLPAAGVYASAELASYRKFLQDKVQVAPSFGVECDLSDVNPLMRPHAAALSVWSTRGGRRGIFPSFGLHKTTIQLETVRITLDKTEQPNGLIILPLGVRQEFIRDAHMLRTGDNPFITDQQRECHEEWTAGRPDRTPAPRFIRTTAEIDEPGIYLTNYESVRLHKIDIGRFAAVSLDEGDILRGCFSGSKTYGEFKDLFEGTSIHRWVATATPSPQEYHELLVYAQFLGIMDIGEARTRFFQRNSQKAHSLTLLPHMEEEFWIWVNSWAAFVLRPSNLGFSDDGYILPDLEVHWHEVPTDHTTAVANERGQGKLIKDVTVGVTSAAKEKQSSLDTRLQKLLELRELDPDAHRIIYHDLENERRALEKSIPGLATIYGSQDLDDREKISIDFSNGEVSELGGKPSMVGAGCNYQRFCHWAIFMGVGFKFRDFFQAIHRIQRFGQPHRCRIDIIFTEAEVSIKEELERRWAQHTTMVERMAGIIEQYGLDGEGMLERLTQSIGVEREEWIGEFGHLVYNDTIEETMSMEDDSVDLIAGSPPFSNQYRYSASYNDLGHNPNIKLFFEQLGYLTRHSLRVLKPGRFMAIHIKDRIRHGNMTGLSFPTIDPFHCYYLEHAKECGFEYCGMVTIGTDVVRENNQTYRLSYSKMLKDSTTTAVGMPEYAMLFRKPQTDLSRGFADERVRKNAEEYLLAQWQIDANGVWLSSGDRLALPEEAKGLRRKDAYRLWKKYCLANPYDYEKHVAFASLLQLTKTPGGGSILPKDFALLPVHAKSPWIWTDVFRAGTLNSALSQKRVEKHVCPMQFDIIDRLIEKLTNPGELVFDPWGGVGTTVVRSNKLGRRGRSHELNHYYWRESVKFAKAQEEKMRVPSLFDLIELEALAAQSDDYEADDDALEESA
jgi:DNA modification methylase